MCDYIVINIATNGAKSNGLSQYYTNSMALEKLLKGVSFARTQELGKLAAAEYEEVLDDRQDYTTSVSRQYQRKSLISGLKPLTLFLKIDCPSCSNPREFARLCLHHGIEGIIVTGS